MSVKNMTWVFENSPYKLGSRLVHLAIADSANDTYGALVWDSQNTIAKKAGVSRATVNSALRQMVKDGWLEEASEQEIESVSLLMKTRQAGVYRFLTCQKSDTPDDARCKDDDGLGVKSTESHLLLTQEEPKANSKPIEPLLGFPEFWGIYPKRNGKRLHRAKCESLWKDIKDIEVRRAAYRGAKNYSDAVEQGCTIARDPDRWLRDKDWTDWQEPATIDIPQREREFAPDVPNFA